MPSPLSSSTDFDRYATKWGGVFHLDRPHANEAQLDADLIHSVMSGMTGVRLQNNRGEKLRLHTGVVNDLDPNAFADKEGSDYFIGVNIGVLFSSWYVCKQLFLRADTFHRIGEAPNHPPTGPVALDADHAQWRDAANPMNDEGLNLPRGQAAVFMRQTVVWFSVLHEWFHVIGGHCDACRSYGGSARLQEVGQGTGNSTSSNVHYLLEYLADARAMEALTGQVATGTDPITATKLFKLKAVERHRLLLSACGIMTAIWDRLNQRPFGDDGRHPRATTRFLHLIQVYRKTVAKHGLSKDDALRIVEMSIMDLRRASRHCPELGLSLDEAIEILRTGRPWDENSLITAVDDAFGDVLDGYSYYDPD